MSDLHKCKKRYPGYYSAWRCWENPEGFLFFGIDQKHHTGFDINYCPFCGYEAKVQTKWKPEGEPDG